MAVDVLAAQTKDHLLSIILLQILYLCVRSSLPPEPYTYAAPSSRSSRYLVEASTRLFSAFGVAIDDRSSQPRGHGFVPRNDIQQLWPNERATTGRRAGYTRRKQWRPPPAVVHGVLAHLCHLHGSLAGYVRAASRAAEIPHLVPLGRTGPRGFPLPYPCPAFAPASASARLPPFVRCVGSIPSPLTQPSCPGFGHRHRAAAASNAAPSSHTCSAIFPPESVSLSQDPAPCPHTPRAALPPEHACMSDTKPHLLASVCASWRRSSRLVIIDNAPRSIRATERVDMNACPAPPLRPGHPSLPFIPDLTSALASKPSFSPRTSLGLLVRYLDHLRSRIGEVRSRCRRRMETPCFDDAMEMKFCAMKLPLLQCTIDPALVEAPEHAS
ncbi:hypothetical protein B0H16DRAFT_1835392 [Mycena metata]|uniref:Uncharacterized protein n=1 Tax=Mycena metata TaxID=1033252 RepID=A0AAD7IYH7_9AGAR|nr:hypothetical protein B0H16DRAFT_1835392 [Mycena metata]